MSLEIHAHDFQWPFVHRTKAIRSVDDAWLRTENVSYFFLYLTSKLVVPKQINERRAAQ